MKHVNSMIGFVVLISSMVFSCGIKKEYSSCDEVIKNIKGVEYDELVKVWGNPEYVEDISNADPSNSKLDLEITVRWGNAKVKLKNHDNITLYFSAVVTGFGNYPYRVKTIHCND